jgi:hypothetical protein
MKNVFDELFSLNVNDIYSRKKLLDQLNHESKFWQVGVIHLAEKLLENMRELTNHKAICRNSIDKLDKIYEQLNGCGESAHRIFELRSALETTYFLKLEALILNYQKVLKNQLENQPFNLDLKEILSRHKKIKACYASIASLGEEIRKKSPLQQIQQNVENVLKVCLNNKLVWSEKSIFEKLIYLLSFVIPFLNYFLLEEQIENQLTEVLARP